MLALKTLVAGLGLLIVLAMTVIGYGLMKKAEDPDFSFFGPSAPPTPVVPTVAGLAPFGDIALGLPGDCVIAEAALVAESRMLLRVGGPGPCARAVVVDLPSGRVLGSVRAH